MSRQPAPPAVRWAAYAAVAVLFAIACAFLSHWQFSRNAERSAQLELVEQNYDAPLVPLATLIPSGGSLAPGDEWRPVTLQGEYLAADQLLARNRPHGGTAAFEVLVPFRLDDGRVLLVNRGWVPPGEQQRAPDAIPAAPAGELSVTVRLRPGEPLASSGRSADNGQIPTIHLPLVADVIDPAAGSVLDQSAYGLLVSEDPAPPTRPTALESPSADPGPYLSYAIQWILFAIMGFIFIGYIIRTELRHRKEDAEDRRQRLRERRQDRDMSDEDAILDSASR